jgi:hypothetical protein
MGKKKVNWFIVCRIQASHILITWLFIIAKSTTWIRRKGR